MTEPVLVLVGPTTVGKTRLAVALAQRLDGEIVNADSRQVLRGLTVATNAASVRELDGVPLHCAAVAEPGEPFTVAAWLRLAREAIDGIRRRGRTPIVTGGTGLYVRSLVDGYDLAATPPDPAVRAQREALLRSPGGAAALAAMLLARDPEAAAGVDVLNPRRVIRALEVLDAHGPPLSARRGQADPLPAVWLWLDAPRAVHARWVQERVRWMFESGALQREVEEALAHGVDATALGRAGIGYREALQLGAGEIAAEEAIEQTLRRTLRYARSQRAWWRALPAPVELDATEPPQTLVTVVARALADAAEMAGARLG